MTVDRLAMLKETRLILAKPENWIQYRFCAHRTVDGTIIDIGRSTDKRANCWCLTGAIMNVIDKYSRADDPSPENCWRWIKTEQNFIWHIANKLGLRPDELSEWHDDQDRTHADILNLLDSLINEGEATA